MSPPYGVLEYAVCRNGNWMTGCPGPESLDHCRLRTEVSFGDDENVLQLDFSDGPVTADALTTTEPHALLNEAAVLHIMCGFKQVT